jgi:cytidylate kinase
LLNIFTREDMMNKHFTHNFRPSVAAERQMRSWAQVQEMAARAVGETRAERLPPRAIKFVAISRESGTDGALVGQLVARTLGWTDYGHNLREEVAQWYHEPRLKLDQVDETTSNWLFDTFGGWMDKGTITHDKFVAQVSHMIHILARRGPAVFVGRGAQFLLPREHTIAVRLVAPESYRLERVQQRQGFATRGEARRYIRSTDAGRNEFVRRHFHHDIADPHCHDLIVNVERCGTVGSAGQIVFAVCRAQGLTAPPEIAHGEAMAARHVAR